MIATNGQFENFIEDDDDRFSEIELRVLDLEKDISEWREARTREPASPARRRPRERGAAGSGSLRQPGPDLAEVGYQPEFSEPGLGWGAGEPEPGWDDDGPEAGWGAGGRGTGWEAGGPGSGAAAAFRATGAPRHREFLRATGKPAPGRDPGRTQALIDHGRQTARPRTVRRQSAAQNAAREKAPREEAPRQKAPRQKRSRSGTARRDRSRHGRTIAVGSAVVLAAAGIGAMIILRPGPSWPASVATVRSEITTACQNPNVVSEPSQVNFACGKDTSQILWVFALLTSDNDPGYADAKTGRKGLEPITAAQGGEIAWSLNLHHPYNPLSAVDSLEVAARAINNIIGGATLTSTSGTPAVQPGLESKPANCARYTGSPAIVSHAGFPSLCVSPVTSREGQAALVADVYQQWMPGTGAVAAQNASVLFQNEGNPGDPQVQAILKTLPRGKQAQGMR